MVARHHPWSAVLSRARAGRRRGRARQPKLLRRVTAGDLRVLPHGHGPFGPVAGQGIGFLDGKGNFHAVVNNSRNGEISLDEEYSGTYTVAPDCTGAFLVDGGESERFVVVDEGKGFYGVSVFEGITAYTVGTRIHVRRGREGAKT